MKEYLKPIGVVLSHLFPGYSSYRSSRLYKKLEEEDMRSRKLVLAGCILGDVVGTAVGVYSLAVGTPVFIAPTILTKLCPGLIEVLATSIDNTLQEIGIGESGCRTASQN